jgi:hypothetical protein
MNLHRAAVNHEPMRSIRCALTSTRFLNTRCEAAEAAKAAGNIEAANQRPSPTQKTFGCSMPKVIGASEIAERLRIGRASVYRILNVSTGVVGASGE